MEGFEPITPRRTPDFKSSAYHRFATSAQSKFGADGETRTRTDTAARPSIWCVYRFHHVRKLNIGMHLADLFENTYLTDQPAFQRWFAGSKIVDAEGNPLKLYRGMRGDYISTADRMEPRKGYAMFFSTSPWVAASYGNPDAYETFPEPGAIFPVYVKADTLKEFPVKIDYYGARRFDMFAFDTVASRLGPGEGVVVRGVVDIGPRAHPRFDPEKKFSYPSDIYSFGRGTQIKSAVSNIGGFSPDDPRMIG